MSLKRLQGGGRTFVFLGWKDFEHIYVLKKEASKEGEIDNITRREDWWWSSFFCGGMKVGTGEKIKSYAVGDVLSFD